MDNPTHSQAMAKFCSTYASHGLDAAVAAIAMARKPPARAISPWVRAACEHYHLTPAQLLQGGRVKYLADARAVTMWLLRYSGASYPAAGEALGGRHHTTVMVGVKKVDAKPELLEQAMRILDKMEREEADLTLAKKRVL
jgi:chromosomal replication initiation ATPase DnaA